MRTLNRILTRIIQIEDTNQQRENPLQSAKLMRKITRTTEASTITNKAKKWTNRSSKKIQAVNQGIKRFSKF